jgi:hypothetical protein
MDLSQLNELERSVLEKLLAGNGRVLSQLRKQLAVCDVENRELTGHGFFTTFAVASEAESASWSGRFGDVIAQIDGLEHGAGFLLTVESGFLLSLEGYSFEEPWPTDVRAFTLEYTQDPRDSSIFES